ncbi:response regulator transcription factor [Cerasicoccus maritimus]|uniref:response regulator transcription factor n=1 Tax=Cerasicoccus maritimus TaxID=490089 RepID=UPI002852CF22|nr:response regulator transcription factor [Cerasicoccus maritimus]
MSQEGEKSILVVDDEPDVTELVEYKLRQAGFRVATINDPLLIMGTAREFQPDLIILDIMMPELSGIQICRMLRADPSMCDIPIVFLTARGEAEDRVKGLETGADDYIGKPFDSRELLLRVSAVLRRVERPTEEPGSTLSISNITLDIEKHRLTLSGKPVELTATEFKLLRLLMERKGRVQSREHLLVNVWNYEADIETRTVDTHIRRLREKLGSEAGIIETVRGVGYRAVDGQ